MKKKFPILFLALALGAPSMFACEWCGHKELQHGIFVNTLTTIAYLLRNFADIHGLNSYPERHLQTEAIVNESNIPPASQGLDCIHLAPWSEARETELLEAANAGQILLAIDGYIYEQNGNEVPIPVEGEHYHGIEHITAYRLSVVLCARALLNLDLENLQQSPSGENLRELLERLFSCIESMELPSDNRGNDSSGWQHDFLRESLFNLRAYWIERLEAVLPDLWDEHDRLDEGLQIPESDRAYLESPEAFDTTWTLMLTRCWRNWFSAKHLHMLQHLAQQRGLQLVALIKNPEMEHLEETLKEMKIPFRRD